MKKKKKKKMCDIMLWNKSLREAAKNVLFYSGQSTKRGKGVRGCPLRKKIFFFFFFFAAEFDHYAEGGGG